MITVSVKADIARFQSKMDQLQADLQRVAIVTAVNKTAEQAKTAAVRDITKTFNLTASMARDRIRVRRASKKFDAITAELIGTQRRSMNLIRFDEKSVTLAEARRRRVAGNIASVFVKVLKGGKVVPVKGKHGYGGFIGNNGRTLFEREGKARLPIVPIRTVDIPQLMVSKIGADNFRLSVAKNFGPNLNREIRRLLLGYGLQSNGARR